VFGDDDPRTFIVAANLAEDQGLNSDYKAALRTDTRTHQDRLDFFGRDDHPWVIYSLGAMARSLRQVGRYPEALTTAEQAYNDFAELVRQRTLPADHQWVLWQAKDLSVARRKMGDRQMTYLQPALELADEVYQKFAASFGDKHPDTLAAAMNCGNARRVFGDVSRTTELLEQADSQVETTFARYREVYGKDHPYALGCALNLAIVRRRVGDLEGARQLLETALAGLTQRLGEQHHYTLTCMTALATSLSDVDETDRAREYGQLAVEGLRQSVGVDHPHTLACASNLAIDLQTLGETEASDNLKTDTVRRYRAILPPDHLDVVDAEESQRIALDFDPPPL
jgi:tetratricopeptide (TPR) repeat protein